MTKSSQLTDLRSELARAGLHGFLGPQADEHLGEYLPPSGARLAWLSGFTGSAGLAIVLADRACLFVDGRYVLQAAAQTDPALWERRHITREPPAPWLAGAVPAGAAIGYDPRLTSEDSLAPYAEAGVTLVPVEANPIDALWASRPAPPLHPASIHPLHLAGRASAEKRAELAAELVKARQDAAVITDPASIAWLLNLRGSDIDGTPVALGFALLRADATVDLFMAQVKLPAEVRAWLGNSVAVREPGALGAALDELSGKRVRVDLAGSPAWFAQRLRKAGASVIAGPDPCTLPKARKNAVEQAGAREAHGRDAVAVCRFLHWLAHAPRQGLDEITAAARLLALRAEQEDFRGESFTAISAAGEHAAIMHYRVDKLTNRAVRADEIYLIDSGGQYGCGTTDVTRTVWTGPGPAPQSLRERFTRVLKGHIAIATLVFPKGVGGAHLDAFARHALWQARLDFDHGTGHGVGSYLAVHEGPVSLSRLARPVPLEAGMLLSNEPGFYAPGEYGIRLENLVLVQPDLAGDGAEFLRFETLTLAPFDRAMIDAGLLSAAERGWLDQYHARVLEHVGPQVPAAERAWLQKVCAPIEA
jgi:Xaa-Pro aminopeptidase